MMVPSGAHIAPLTCVLLCMCAQVGFRHPKDYVSYVWARSDDGERCLEKQLCAQVSWGQPCCLAGTSAPRCGRQWPVCAPGWGRQAPRYCFVLSLGQARGVGNRDLCFWLGLELGGGAPLCQPWCPSGVCGLQVMFSEEALPKRNGEYILGYYSNTSSSIAGVTEPFQMSTGKRGGGMWEGGSLDGGDQLLWYPTVPCERQLAVLMQGCRSPYPGQRRAAAPRTAQAAAQKRMTVHLSSWPPNPVAPARAR